VHVQLFGDEGNDFLFGGNASTDLLDGGPDNDRLYSDDGFKSDHVVGGTGFDDAVADENDRLDSVEVKSLIRLGRLRLAPPFVQANAGKTARVTMSWKHPKAWRELRSINMPVVRSRTASRKPRPSVSDPLSCRGRIASSDASSLRRERLAGAGLPNATIPTTTARPSTARCSDVPVGFLDPLLDGADPADISGSFGDAM
jgi:hypothetical protein